VTHDIEGARRAGMRGVLVHRSGDSPAAAEDIPVIRDLSQLPPLL
jgi:FMN phosphatase YigB (HAD superfamily)